MVYIPGTFAVVQWQIHKERSPPTSLSAGVHLAEMQLVVVKQDCHTKCSKLFLHLICIFLGEISPPHTPVLPLGYGVLFLAPSVLDLIAPISNLWICTATGVIIHYYSMQNSWIKGPNKNASFTSLVLPVLHTVIRQNHKSRTAKEIQKTSAERKTVKGFWYTWSKTGISPRWWR